MTGVKHDAGKLRWHLLPFTAVGEIVRVLEFGAEKYSENNWQQVDDFTDRYFDAAMRHLVAWRSGENLDPESGLHHLAHAGCNILFLIWRHR